VTLFSGVHPSPSFKARASEEWRRSKQQDGPVKDGDMVVTVSDDGKIGTRNTMKIMRVGDHRQHNP
jgi:hypothetical protein